jgi:hypothetical protein
MPQVHYSKSVKLVVALDLLNTPTSHFCTFWIQIFSSRQGIWFRFIELFLEPTRHIRIVRGRTENNTDNSVRLSRDLNTDLPQNGEVVLVTQSWGSVLSVLLMRSLWSLLKCTLWWIGLVKHSTPARTCFVSFQKVWWFLFTGARPFHAPKVNVFREVRSRLRALSVFIPSVKKTV